MNEESGSSKDALTPKPGTSKNKNKSAKTFEVPEDLLKKSSVETVDPDNSYFESLQESDSKSPESTEKEDKSPLGGEKKPVPLSDALKRSQTQDKSSSDDAPEKKSEAPTVVAAISKKSDSSGKKPETATDVAPLSETPDKKPKAPTGVATMSDTPEKNPETPTDGAPISEDTPEKKPKTPIDIEPITKKSDNSEKKSKASTGNVPIVNTPEKKLEEPTNVAPLSEKSDTPEKKPEAPKDVAPISEKSDTPETKPKAPTDVAPISEKADTSEKNPEAPTDVAPISKKFDSSEKKPEAPTDVAPITEKSDTSEKIPEAPTDVAPVSEKSDISERKPEAPTDVAPIGETSDTPEKTSEAFTVVEPISDTPDSLDSETDESSSESKTPEGILKPKKKQTYFQKKRSSIVQFLTGKKSGEDDETGQRPRAKKRPSYIRRKMIAFEKELTMESINKKVTSIYVPDDFKSDVSEDQEDKKEEQEKKPERESLSSAMACIFIIGVTTGSAFAALPFYLKQSSWFGMFLIMLLCLNSVYSGLCTGWCWTLMEEKWPEYLEYSRIPYQDMAYRSIGPLMKYIVAVFVDVSLLGNCAVYVLLIADTIENIAHETSFAFCYILIVIVVALMPFTMFGSYRNVKFIGIIDVIFSVLFSISLIASFFLHKPTVGPSTYSDRTYADVVAAFSGFSFSYAAGSMIPSILSDMEDRSQFTQACVTGYLVVLTIYIIPAILGYAAYGDDTPEYILKPIFESEKLHYLAIGISVLHIIQLGTTFILAIFPTLHAFEERLRCPNKFGCCRFMLRLIIVAAILAVILGVPSFPKYMTIVFSSTFGCTTFIFPPVFYVFMVYQQSEKSTSVLSKKEWFLILETVLLGFIVAGVGTRKSLNDFERSEEDRISCYTNLTHVPISKRWLIGARRRN